MQVVNVHTATIKMEPQNETPVETQNDVELEGDEPVDSVQNAIVTVYFILPNLWILQIFYWNTEANL